MNSIFYILLSVYFMCFATNGLNDDLPVNTSKIICYFGSGAEYREGEGQFFPEDIDPNMCTHIVYAYDDLNFKSRITYHEGVYENDEMYERVTSLKLKNPQLKIVLSVTDYFDSPTKSFEDLFSTKNSRKDFIKNAIDFLILHKFDGLEISSNGKYSDMYKNYFTSFLREFRLASIPYGLLLSIAVLATKEKTDSIYEISKISGELDWININTNYFNSQTSNTTIAGVALYSGVEDNEPSSQLNIDWTISYWLSKGAEANKLIINIPLYGNAFTLLDCENNYLGAKTVKGATKGPAARILSHYEICNLLLNQEWTRQWNNEQKVTYAFKDDQWVGYEDSESLNFKIDYIKEHKLGGISFWSLDMDDFKGVVCQNGTYPLIKYALKQLTSVSKAKLPEKLSKEPTNDMTVNGAKKCVNSKSGVLSSSGNCICMIGYSGPNCETYLGCKEEGILACKNNGVCSNFGKCLCSHGYSGNTCQKFLGCKLGGIFNCQNGGKCADIGVCNCTMKFKGTRCEIPVK